nr:MAG TPA: hypothetical protein [Caudoviricetes sp.]
MPVQALPIFGVHSTQSGIRVNFRRVASFPLPPIMQDSRHKVLVRTKAPRLHSTVIIRIVFQYPVQAVIQVMKIVRRIPLLTVGNVRPKPSFSTC